MKCYVRILICGAVVTLSVCFADTALSQELLGEWYDQDKTVSSFGVWDKNYWSDNNLNGIYEPHLGETWSDSVGVDTDQDYEKDPGEIWGLWDAGGDATCWAAAATNLIEYVGGENTYMAWVYEADWADGSAYTWQTPGGTDQALNTLDLPNHHYFSFRDDGTWPSYPINRVADALADGMPVSLGVTWHEDSPWDIQHLITCYGIDTSAQTITLACSDTDVDGTDFHTYTYTYDTASDPDMWRIDDYVGNPWVSATYFYTTNSWQGAGTGGDTATSGHSANWHDSGNWEGSVPDASHPTLFPRVEFENAGQVNIGAAAVAQKLIIRDYSSHVKVHPTGSLDLGAFYIEGGTLEVYGWTTARGTLNANRAEGLYGLLHVDGGIAELGPLTFAGTNITVENHGSLTVNGDTLMSDNAHLTVAGAGTVATFDGDLSLDRRLIVRDHASLEVAGAFDLNASGSVDSEVEDADVTLGASSRLRAGNLTITHSDFTIGGTGDLNVGDIAEDAMLSLRGSTLELNRLILGKQQDSNVEMSFRAYDGRDMFINTYGYDGGVVVGYEGTARVIQHSGTLTHRAGSTYNPSVTLGAWGGSSGTYTIHDGVMNLNALVVGNYGDGEFFQEGGIVESDTHVLLGNQTSGNGTYHLNGGTLRVEQFENRDGSGTFNYNGGTLDLVGDTHSLDRLNIGHAPGSDATLDLITKTLDVSNMGVGVDGHGALIVRGSNIRVGSMLVAGSNDRGTVEQYSGTVTTGYVMLAEYEGGDNSRYTIEGGTLDADVIKVGYRGHAAMTQRNDAAVVAGQIDVGDRSSSILNSYKQYGGTVDVSGTLYLGSEGGARGHYLLDGDSLATTLTTATTHVGHYGHGHFDHLGGLHETTTLEVGGGDGGRYWFTGGRIEAANTSVGVRGEGQFDHRGGMHFADTLTIGADSFGAYAGTYNLENVGYLDTAYLNVAGDSGGTLSQTGGTNIVRQEMHVGHGDDTVGVVEHSEGSATIIGDLIIGNGAGSEGTYNLSGGAVCYVQGTFEIGRGTGSVGHFMLENPDTLLRLDSDSGIGRGGAGTLEVRSSAEAQINAKLAIGSATTTGELLMVGGSVKGTGLLTVNDTGTIRGRGAIHTPINNHGTIDVDTSSIMLYDTLDSDGDVTVADGCGLSLWGDATFIGPIASDGSIGAGSGATVLIQGGMTGNGSLDAYSADVDIQSDVHCRQMSVENGQILHTSGTTTVAEKLMVGQTDGYYGLHAGALLEAATAQVDGLFDHMAGTSKIETLYLGGSTSWGYGGETGEYAIASGRLTAGTLSIGDGDDWTPGGLLSITDTAAEVYVTDELILGANGSVSCVEGNEIHMTGSAFSNYSTEPAVVAQIEKLKLIFEGGPAVVDPFEVAGQDMGATMNGLSDNFALGCLQIGGDNTSQLQLRDAFDNCDGWEGIEALYVKQLIIGAGSKLDLNGINLYYLFAEIDAAAEVIGGSLTQVPEPGMLVLMLCVIVCLSVVRSGRSRRGLSPHE